MNKIRIGFVAYTLLATTVAGVAQDPDPAAQEMQRWAEEEKRHVAQLLQIIFEQKRTRANVIRIADDLLCKHPEFTLRTLERSQSDTSERVRVEAYAYAWRVGIALPGRPFIRRTAVEQLAKACLDPHALVWQSAARWLLDFNQSDFTPEARGSLHEIFNLHPVRREVLLVFGVAGMTEMMSWMEKISDKHFNAVLARARLGDDDAAREAVRRIDRLENINRRIYGAVKRLGYTHHPIVLEYIASYLDRDDGGITLKQGGDYGRPSIQQAALEAIAANFPNCPVKKSKLPSKYDRSDYEMVKQWVRDLPKAAPK